MVDRPDHAACVARIAEVTSAFAEALRAGGEAGAASQRKDVKEEAEPPNTAYQRNAQAEERQRQAGKAASMAIVALDANNPLQLLRVQGASPDAQQVAKEAGGNGEEQLQHTLKRRLRPGAVPESFSAFQRLQQAAKLERAVQRVRAALLRNALQQLPQRVAQLRGSSPGAAAAVLPIIKAYLLTSAMSLEYVIAQVDRLPDVLDAAELKSQIQELLSEVEGGMDVELLLWQQQQPQRRPEKGRKLQTVEEDLGAIRHLSQQVAARPCVSMLPVGTRGRVLDVVREHLAAFLLDRRLPLDDVEAGLRAVLEPGGGREMEDVGVASSEEAVQELVQEVLTFLRSHRPQLRYMRTETELCSEVRVLVPGTICLTVALTLPGLAEAATVAACSWDELSTAKAGTGLAYAWSRQLVFRKVAQQAQQALHFFRCRYEARRLLSDPAPAEVAGQLPREPSTQAAAGEVVLEELLTWLTSFRGLFSKPCQYTGQLLSADPETFALLPPIGRPFMRPARDLRHWAANPTEQPVFHPHALEEYFT